MRMVVATVIKEISLPHTTIKVDTKIIVDVEKAVAYFGGCHFDILPDEYALCH